MSQFYTNPKRENDKYALPDAEVFYVAGATTSCHEDTWYSEPGYYYHYCFPGCLPDSDPCGPFDSEQAAIDDARENAGAFDDED